MTVLAMSHFEPGTSNTRTRPSAIPGRTIPLALRNLTESPFRLAASVSGVAFAVVLMFLQNGFRNALLDNMVAVVEHLDGELFILSRNRYILSQPVSFPLRRIARAGGVPGVRSVHPFYLATEMALRWRNPETYLARSIRVLAYRPADELLDLPEVRAQRPKWERPLTALADRRSKVADYGPLRADVTSELAGRRVRIVGTFALGTDFRTNGTLVMSEANLLRYWPARLGPSRGDTRIDVGVIRTDSDAALERVRASVAGRLTPDLVVLTKPELMAQEQGFWSRVTPVGMVFNIGVVMGVLVGLAIGYQVLYAEIHDRLAQFATLKAMGYTDAALRRTVVEQGVFLALLGYGVGLAVSLGLFAWLQRITGLTMRLRPLDALLVLGLTLAMCVTSGLLAARKLRTVDPAELFG
jgi:putative ABC transport system permease protein